MEIGMSYAAMPYTGPLSTSRKSTSRRFEPYPAYSSGIPRTCYPANNEACGSWQRSEMNYFPANVQPATSSADCQIYRDGTRPACTLYDQDFLSLLTGSQWIGYSQAFGLKTLHNLCDPVTHSGTSSANTSFGGKDRSHSFYLRRRTEPAEGMTRTRDKYRVVYTEKQRKGLDHEYHTNKFITPERKAEISKELGLSERQIKIWFQNRRAKERRDSRKTKFEDQTDSSKSEDDRDVIDNSVSTLASTSLQTSCRFATGSTQFEQNTFNPFLPDYLNDHQTGHGTSHSLNSVMSPASRSHDSGIRTCSVSPTDWNAPTHSGFIPPLNVSPIIGHLHSDFTPRL